MPQVLRLTLNGTFAAEGPDGPLPKIGRRGQALLAFLALEPRQRATRSAAMTLLWGDRSEEQARASLRQELSALRRILPEGALHADRSEVWLEGTTLAERPTEQLLAGFDLPSEPFEDWLRQSRAATLIRTEEPQPTKNARGRPVVAVLPFAELGVADADMFADGVVEEITGALSRVHDFHVIARQSTFALKDEALDAREVSERLGATCLVEGTVRRSGDRVRIAVTLVNGSDGRALWSERFDDQLDDLFDLQDRVSAKVAGQISPSLRLAEVDRARSTPPKDRSAYELVLSAMPYFWAHRNEDNLAAIELFDAALKRDPDYGLALAMKAWGLAQRTAYLWSDTPKEVRAEATRIAGKAAELAGDHALTLVGIGAAISMCSEDIERASEVIERALEIDPNSAWGWMRKGYVHVYSDEAAEARTAFDRAAELSPLDPYLHNMVVGQGMAEFRRKNYEEAARLIEQSLRMGPGAQWAYRPLISIYTVLGRDEDVRRVSEAFFEAHPGITLKHILDSLPPTFSLGGYFPVYFDGLRKAGVPEE
jgi:TolB-like protein